MAHDYRRMNPWLASLFCHFGLIFMLAGKCWAQPDASLSLDDLLTGNKIPDFTAIYQCRVRNALAGTPREQIAQQAQQWGADYAKRYPKDPRPSDAALQITEQIMQQVTADAKAAQTVCTISKRGNKLLVITQFGRATITGEN